MVSHHYIGRISPSMGALTIECKWGKSLFSISSGKSKFPEAKCPWLFFMNTASMLESEFSLEADPKNSVSSSKAAAAAENPASAFSGSAISAGHAVASISSVAGSSVQSGEDPGTHTHASKAKRRKPNFPATQIRTTGPKVFQATQHPLCCRNGNGLELQERGNTAITCCWPIALGRCGSSEDQWSCAQFSHKISCPSSLKFAAVVALQLLL